MENRKMRGREIKARRCLNQTNKFINKYIKS